MGRNADKRRARKARSKGPRAQKKRAAQAAPREAAPEALPRPRWLRPGLEIVPSEVDPTLDEGGDHLDLTTLCAAGAGGHELAEALVKTAASDAALLVRLGPDHTLEVQGAYRLARPDGDSGLLPLLTPELVEEVVGADHPVLIRDVPRDVRTPSSSPSAKTGSLLCARLRLPPLPDSGEEDPDAGTWGVMALGRREVGAFFERDVEICTRLARGLGQDMAQAEALRRGFTDPRTGLMGRQALLLLLGRELERGRRRERPLSALVLEPDAGADDLTSDAFFDVAGKLAELAREAELCGRLLGQQFLVLLDAPIDAAEEAAGRILEDLTREEEDGEPATWSAGLAEAGLREMGPELLGRALGALRVAKKEGGARVVKSREEADELESGSDQVQAEDPASKDVADGPVPVPSGGEPG